MTDRLAIQYFERLRAQYFDPLCQSLELIVEKKDVSQGFEWVCAKSRAVRVYFEYERGLGFFSIGATPDPRPLCSVEKIAQRFPRLRILSEGSQRLSLDEQRSFLEGKWNDLQVMFSPEHLPETRKWHEAAAAAYMKKYT